MVRSLPLLQRIGQIDRQARGRARGPVAQFGQYHVKLHVAHRVRCHQQFEPVQAGDQIVLDILRPHPRRDAFDLGRDLFDHLGQKGAGAGGRIKDLDAMHLFSRGDGFALGVGLARIPIERDL